MLKVNSLSSEELISKIVSNTKNYCFILGAGASVESGIPLGTTLEYCWMKYLTGQEDDIDGTPKILSDYKLNIKSRKLKQKYKKILRIWEKNNCTYLPSEYYFDLFDIRFNRNLKLSEKYFQYLMADKDPSVGYFLFSKILTDGEKNNIVVTTNFDNLISISRAKCFIKLGKNDEALNDYNKVLDRDSGNQEAIQGKKTLRMLKKKKK